MAPKRQPTPASHRIRSLEVKGGFLDGLKIELSPRLNCVIGGRGTGKTTVLQFLRWALKDAQEAGRRDRKDLVALIKENLRGTGVVRVEIETKDGLCYVVERGGAGQAPEVLDQAGAAAGFTLAHGAIFDLEVYGQNEIEGIASTPSAQLELIDRFVAGQLRELQEELAALQVELEANARELLALGAQQGEIGERVKELPALLAKLRAQESAERTESGEEVNRALELKALRERETRIHEQLERHLRSSGEALLELERRLATEAPLFPLEALQGPNRAHNAAAAGKVEALTRDAERVLRDLARRFATAVEDLRATRGELGRDQAQQEASFRAALSRHEAAQGSAQERLQLQRRVNELRELEKTLVQRTGALQAKQRQRRDLLRRLVELRGRRYELRRGAAARLTEALGPGIRVTIHQATDFGAYGALLSEALRSAPRHHQLADTLAKRVVPAELMRIVHTDAVNDLAELTGQTPQRAAWIVEELRDKPVLYQLETVEVADVPAIELLDGNVYKPASALSTGQRCTTILPILLLENDKPLLIDQPEDHLDNRFLVTNVVEQIKAIKARRQLFFVTHNPNIPVLGDAERVFVLESDGARARVVRSGTIDQVKEHVETILEGGAEAFEERRRRYGR